MVRYALFAATILLLSAPQLAGARDGEDARRPDDQAYPAMGMMQHGQDMGGAPHAPQTSADPREEAAHFPEAKAEIIRHINAHLAEVQQHLQCVQAANDPLSLRACKPPRRPHEGGRHGQDDHGAEGHQAPEPAQGRD